MKQDEARAAADALPSRLLACASALEATAVVASDASHAWVASVLPAQHQLEALCDPEADPPAQDARADAASDTAPLTDPVLVVSAAAQFVAASPAFVDAACARNAGPAQLLGGALRVLACEQLRGWPGSMAVAGELLSALQSEASVVAEHRMRARLLERSAELLRRAAPASSRTAASVDQLLATRALLEPTTATELAGRFYDYRVDAAAAIRAATVAPSAAATAAAAAAAALTDLCHILYTSHPRRLAMFSLASAAPPEGAEARAAQLASSRLLSGCTTPFDVLDLYSRMVAHGADADAEAQRQGQGQEGRPADPPPLPPLPPLLSAASLAQLLSGGGGGSTAGAGATAEGHARLRAAVRISVEAVLRSASEHAALPQLLALLAEAAAAAGLEGGAEGAAAGQEAERDPEWLALLRHSLYCALDDALASAAASSPLSPLLQEYLAAAAAPPSRGAPGKPAAEALPVLSWRGGSEPSALPSWRAVPPAMRGIADTLGLAIVTAERQYSLAAAATKPAPRPAAANAAHAAADAAAAAADAAEAQRAAQTFGLGCVAPLVGLLEDAVAPHLTAPHLAHSTHTQPLAEPQAAAGAAPDGGTAVLLAAWVACISLSQQLLRTAVLASGSRSTLANDVAAARRALGAIGASALDAWARSLAAACSTEAASPPVDEGSPSPGEAGATSERLGWRAVALAGATVAPLPLPQRPSDTCAARVWSLLRALRSSAAAPLHPAMLRAVASHAQSAIALAMEAPVACACAGNSADRLMQLALDLGFLEAALGSAAPAGSPAAAPAAPSLASRRQAVSAKLRSLDPIAHAVAERPLAAAAAAAAASLGTLLAPLSAAAEPPPAAGRLHASAPPAAAAAAAPSAPSLLELPPPCARFAYLPVQTPPLHGRAAALGGGAAAGGGVPGTPSATAGRHEREATDEATASDRVSSVLSRVGGIVGGAISDRVSASVSSGSLASGLGLREGLGGRMLASARESAQGLSAKGLAAKGLSKESALESVSRLGDRLGLSAMIEKKQ